jgi:hypothetical protein
LTENIQNKILKLIRIASVGRQNPKEVLDADIKYDRFEENIEKKTLMLI